MGGRSRRLILAALALVGAATWFWGAPAAGEATRAPFCDASTPLTLLALDTATGRGLFTLPGDPPHLIELDPLAATARRWRHPPAGRHFAGSAGPGPLFALRRCGAECVQAEGWVDGAWEPWGDPLALPTAANLFATYDRDRAPWIVTHQRTASPGWIAARAFRFDGGTWRPQGRLLVTAVATLGAAPASWRRDAVVTGTGLFTAGEEPRQWVAGLPALPEGKGGQVLALDGTAAAYLAGDGALYLSPDRGRTWTGSRWKPWGVERSDIWTYGTDYSLDIPLGALGNPLPVAWFDRRPGRDGRIHLTELAPDGGWRRRTELAPEILADTGETLEIFHLFRTDAGTWILATDCFMAGSTPGLGLRTYSLSGLSGPRFVPIR